MTIGRESLRPAFERYWAGLPKHSVAGPRQPDGGYVAVPVRGDKDAAWSVWCAAFESLGEPVGYADIGRYPFGSPYTHQHVSAVVLKQFPEQGGTPLYRLPEVKG